MKRIIGFFSLLLVLPYLGQSQSFSISGSVKTYQMVGISDWLVTIESTPGIWPYYFNQVFTDSLGHYQTTGAINDSVTLQMTVSTYDCGMSLTDTSFVISAGQSVQANFVICDPTPCVANYYYQVVNDSTNGRTLQFFNTSSGPYYEVLWDFGDGTTSTEISPIHTFASGSWVTCLVISDPLPPSGCSDVDCKTIQISGGEPCTNSFTYEINGLYVAFSGTTNGNIPATYYWNFGDGSSGEGQTTEHSFQSTGTYAISLTTIQSDTCTAISTQNITIDSTECVAGYTWYADSIQPNLIHFTNTSTGTQAVEWQWEFGDGSTSNLDSPDHTFSPGSWDVCMTIYTATCTETYCETIVINATHECQANFSYVMDPGNNLTLHFTDQSTGDINLWIWDFGDGNESILQNPDHTFEQAGQYTICLNVFTADSICQAIYCQTITVNPLLYFPVIGQVLAGFFPADGIAVELYNAANNLPVLVDTAFTGEFGAFAFYTVPQGEHFIKATPALISGIFGNYLPTYSGNTVLWEQAIALNVTQAISGADITLVANPVLAQGNGLISGTLKGSVTDNSSQGQKIFNVPIYLFSPENDLLHAAFTDTYGNFAFNNVPYGNYLVLPEITGLHAEAFPINLEAGNTSHTGITFTVSELGIQYGIDDPLPQGISGIGLPWPNPTKGKVQLNIDASLTASGSLVLSNLNGNIVKEIPLELVAGNNQLKLDFGTVPKGVYALILQMNSGKVFIHKIVVL